MSSATKPVEQKARELLASTYADPDCALQNMTAHPTRDQRHAIRAIIAALNTDGAEQIAENANCSGTDGERIRRLEDALKEMVYETTHLSPCEVDGSHRCIISAEALKQAREALSTPSKGVG